MPVLRQVWDYFGFAALAGRFFASIFPNARSSAPGDSSAPTSAAIFWKRSSWAGFDLGFVMAGDPLRSMEF